MARKHSRLNLSKGGRLETLWSENRPTSAPSDPKWTSNNLKLQPHELQQNPEIAEQSACVQTKRNKVSKHTSTGSDGNGWARHNLNPTTCLLTKRPLNI